MAFITTDESDTTIEVYSLDARLIKNITLPGKGAVAVGDFLAEEDGEEIALQTGRR